MANSGCWWRTKKIVHDLCVLKYSGLPTASNEEAGATYKALQMSRVSLGAAVFTGLIIIGCSFDLPNFRYVYRVWPVLFLIEFAVVFCTNFIDFYNPFDYSDWHTAHRVHQTKEMIRDNTDWAFYAYYNWNFLVFLIAIPLVVASWSLIKG